MPISIRDAGVWKEAEPHVRDAGLWKPVDTGSVRDAGVWKEFYKSGNAPFVLSGSWETGLEGWTVSDGGSRVSNASIARTGSWVLYNGNAENLTAQYTLPTGAADGLTVTASVYCRFLNGFVGGGAFWRLLVSKSGGAFTEIARNNSPTTSYSLLSGTTSGVAGTMVFRVEMRGSMFDYEYPVLDDWTIEGS